MGKYIVRRVALQGEEGIRQTYGPFETKKACKEFIHKQVVTSNNYFRKSDFDVYETTKVKV